MTRGHPALVLDNSACECSLLLSSLFVSLSLDIFRRCFILLFTSDYWDGENVRELTEAHLARLFTQACEWSLQSDQHVVAFSYSPLNQKTSVQFPRVARKREFTNLYQHCVKIVPEVPSDQSPIPPSAGPSSIPPFFLEPPAIPILNEQADIMKPPNLARSHGGPTAELIADVKDSITKQVFLGMCTMSHPPNIAARTLIKQLSKGGIRFVYLSPKGEKQVCEINQLITHCTLALLALSFYFRFNANFSFTRKIVTLVIDQVKSIAYKLDMEVDWNTCIILDDHSPLPMQMRSLHAHDFYQPLPRGISAVRPHLQDIDQLPLLVHLFAESSPKSSLEMMKIFQENGDVVCCLNHSFGILSSAILNQCDACVLISGDVGMVTPTPLPHHAQKAQLSFVMSLPKLLTLPKVHGIEVKSKYPYANPYI
jgi:hypothetical protein